MKRILPFGIVILFIIYLLGPNPDDPTFDLSLPDVPSSAEALEAHIAEIESQHELKADNEAEIIWNNDSTKEKTEYVLLYLHGFTASKMEGEPLHRRFAEKYACNAYFARLTDHGIDTTDPLFLLTPDRLWESAKHALAIAQQLGDKVIIMSTSTGGTLALNLASEYSSIAGLINLSPNIKLKDPTAFLLNDPWGKQIANLVLDGDFRVLTGMDDFYGKYWYVKYRVEGIVALEELLESTMHAYTFMKVRVPTVNLFYFKDKKNQDEVVDVNAIIKMHQQLGTPDHLKRLVPIENANNHVIGSGRYSEAYDQVESEVFQFADEILELNKATSL